MKKQKKIKIITSIFIFILGSIGSLYMSVYIHTLLSNGDMSLDILKIRNSIQIIKDDLKALKLFGCFELLTLLSSFFYAISSNNNYKSELIEITPAISIPVEAGQKQFGSSRFMTEDEKKKTFTILEIKKDKRIKRLLQQGYDDVKNLKGGDKK